MNHLHPSSPLTIQEYTAGFALVGPPQIVAQYAPVQCWKGAGSVVALRTALLVNSIWDSRRVGFTVRSVSFDDEGVVRLGWLNREKVVLQRGALISELLEDSIVTYAAEGFIEQRVRIIGMFDEPLADFPTLGS